MVMLKPDSSVGDVSSVRYKDMAQKDGSAFNDFFEVDSRDTDGPSGQAPSTWIPEFAKWHGHYRTIPEFRAIVDTIIRWVLGNGFTADEKTMKKIKNIRGWGKDDFLSILKNQLKVCMITGDSFAEDIQDKKNRLINLKPLNAGSIRINVNESGIIDKEKGYTQVSQGKDGKETPFKRDEIFHLCWQRIADEIHGIPLGEAMEDLIKMRNEVMFDQKVFFHRYVNPVQIVPLNTENETEKQLIKNNYKEAWKRGEIMFTNEGLIDFKNVKNLLGDLPNIDPLPWLKFLVRQFVTASGVPEIILGWGADTTEATSKVIVRAWEQTVKEIQLWLETQIKLQLNLDIKLNPSISIEEELEGQGKPTTKIDSLASDSKKDG